MQVPWTFEEVSNSPRLIGMVHLRPLPGSPRFHEGSGSMTEVIDEALRDAEALLRGGVDGLLIENYGDAPFFAERVPAITIASLCRVVSQVMSRCDKPVGINVLRNDGLSALAIAVATEASWIRVNVLAGTRLGDQGLLRGMASDLLRERAALQPLASLAPSQEAEMPALRDDPRVAIWADLRVKHSTPLGVETTLQAEASDLVHRSFADALILSGPATGAAADPEQIDQLRGMLPETPIIVGSGVTAENVDAFRYADALIVGTSLKVDGLVQAPIDPARVRRFVQALRG